MVLVFLYGASKGPRGGSREGTTAVASRGGSSERRVIDATECGYIDCCVTASGASLAPMGRWQGMGARRCSFCGSQYGRRRHCSSCGSQYDRTRHCSFRAAPKVARLSGASSSQHDLATLQLQTWSTPWPPNKTSNLLAEVCNQSKSPCKVIVITIPTTQPTNRKLLHYSAQA